MHPFWCFQGVDNGCIGSEWVKKNTNCVIPFFKLFLIKIEKIGGSKMFWNLFVLKNMKNSLGNAHDDVFSRNIPRKIWNFGLRLGCFPKNYPNLSRAAVLRNTCPWLTEAATGDVIKKDVFKNFAKFIGIKICIRVFIKKETLRQVFSMNFVKF